MKKKRNPLNSLVRTGLLVCMFLILFFTGISGAADVISANLKAVPMYAKPGAQVQFQTTVFFHPDFYVKPGEMVQILVTRNDFSWVSDKHIIKYPGSGGSLTVNFSDKFTIPSDAKPGQAFDFVLVNTIWWPISQKISVKVKGVILKKKENLIYKKKPEIRPVEKKKGLKKVPVTN